MGQFCCKDGNKGVYISGVLDWARWIIKKGVVVAANRDDLINGTQLSIWVCGIMQNIFGVHLGETLADLKHEEIRLFGGA